LKKSNQGYIIWDKTPTSPLKADISEENIASIFKDGSMSQARTQHKAGSKESSISMLFYREI
jgi:hypothetical protein